MLLFDDLFDIASGYVLNFTNQTFSQFFASEIGMDIDDPVFRRNGDSRGKRLRCFL